MATKKTKTTKTTKTTRASHTSTNGIIRACTYFALVIAAAIFLFSGLVRFLDIAALTRLVSVFNLIGQICLVIGIAFPAYDFTCGKKRVWRVIFWVALAIYVLGCEFGVLQF